MILPDLVFGRSSTTTTFFGDANAPILSRTCRLNFPARSAGSSDAVVMLMKDTTAWPVNSSFTPTTAASATEACERSAASISAVDKR